VNPYGQCHHTKYEGCPPCVHSAWNDGVQAARAVVEAYADERLIKTKHPNLSEDITAALRVAVKRIDALRGES